MDPISQIASTRTNTPQASIITVHEEGPKGMLQDERNFRKDFFEMYEMVNVLYEERNSRLYGEISKPPKGDGGKGDKPPKNNGANDDKPPPSYPS